MDSPSRSKYGSIEPNEPPANGNESITSERDTSENRINPVPPKPAIRHRMQNAPKIDEKEFLSTVARITRRPLPDYSDSESEPATSPEPISARFVDISPMPSSYTKRDSSGPIEMAEPSQLETTKIYSSPNKAPLQALPMPTETMPTFERPYPKKVFFIIGSEFCERFSYYGLRTILVLYFKSILGLTDTSATVSFHLFAALCYVTPIFGAILADSMLGTFRTILYLSIVYFVGELMLVLSSIFWNLNQITMWGTILGLLLIGVGTGGIKPCVCALGGDQFLSNEEQRRQTFFSMFYASINLGALISTFLTPMLRSGTSCVNRSDCYPLAFGVPCILMFISIVVFLLAQNKYNLLPLPENNIIVLFVKCICLALKRKIAGVDQKSIQPINANRSYETSSSDLSMSSNEEAIAAASKLDPLALKEVRKDPINADRKLDDESWLDLARDKFDRQSIGDFKKLINMMVIGLPLPVYWCLFDQQGSSWTLQATRMDGRVFGSNFTLQPDQMSVANPVLLLASIPVFEVVIYPLFKKCNLLTKPISRITAGGLLAALTFVVSAVIEIHIQNSQPMEHPMPGRVGLLLVNGLGDCTIGQLSLSDSNPSLLSATNATSAATTMDLNTIEPLGAKYFDLANDSASLTIKFRLLDRQPTQIYQNSISTKPIECPINSLAPSEFNVRPFNDSQVKMLYVDFASNAKLGLKYFNESLRLPGPGKARVRLLFDSFGSSNEAAKREFYLTRSAINGSQVDPELRFKTALRNGQVFLSDYLEVSVLSEGETFKLLSSDGLVKAGGNESGIILKPGTRNLVIAQQRTHQSVDVSHKILQDNEYRVSMLYQLVPYLMISMSEVMFSITGLEFCYSMAPESMRSVIMGIWSLQTAIGNLLTIAVKSMSLFSNVAYDFLFYAALMTVDMLIFAIIGFYRTSR